MLKTGADLSEARKRLASAGGNVRKALEMRIKTVARDTRNPGTRK
jgi:N-acetylmuramic acid 6-phosphate (MurNAc-6-P) etherase